MWECNGAHILCDMLYDVKLGIGVCGCEVFQHHLRKELVHYDGTSLRTVPSELEMHVLIFMVVLCW